MWIDTHAHLYLKAFNDDRSELMDRVDAAKISHVFLPDIDSSTSASLDEMVKLYPSCYAMSGLHPCSVKENYKEELKHVRGRIDSIDSLVGVGEVGLDFYWDKTFTREQYEAFETQIEWAREMDLPIIIHSRDSLDETITTIEKMTRGDLRGIFHCFNGNLEQAKRIMDVGFLMGLGGVITFKKVDMDETIRNIAEDSLVLETDAPYLSPVPYRGKRNESSYIPYVGEYIAKVREQSVVEIAEMTSRNAKNLFGVE